MLNLLRSDFVADASTEAVARALAALTSADLLRLKRLAQLRARLLPGLEWDELLNEAVLRALTAHGSGPRVCRCSSFSPASCAALSIVAQRSGAGWPSGHLRGSRSAYRRRQKRSSMRVSASPQSTGSLLAIPMCSCLLLRWRGNIWEVLKDPLLASAKSGATRRANASPAPFYGANSMGFCHD